MGFNPPQPKSLFESPSEQFSRLPDQPARPSDLFSTAVPAFPSQLARPMAQPAMDLQSNQSMAPTLADRGRVSFDIGGMQGKTPIQTPYGTVYATAQQAGTGRVAEMGGLPAQSARLANIGERARGMGMARRGGQQIAENYRTTMTNFANRNISSPVNLPAPQDRFGRALVGMFPSSREAMARAEKATSPTSSLASMGNTLSFPFMEERNRNPFSSIYGFAG